MVEPPARALKSELRTTRGRPTRQWDGASAKPYSSIDTRYASWSTTKNRAVFSVKGTALGSPPTPDPPCAAPDLAGREQIWTGDVDGGDAFILDTVTFYIRRHTD